MHLAVLARQLLAEQRLARGLHVLSVQKGEAEKCFWRKRRAGIKSGGFEALAVERYGFPCMREQGMELAELLHAKLISSPPLALVQLVLHGQQACGCSGWQRRPDDV